MVFGSDLPGSPDIVLPRYKTAIFVNGCFWHGHECQHGRIPSSNSEYWAKKIARNMERDQENCQALLDMGWNVEVIWECKLDAGIDCLINGLSHKYRGGNAVAPLGLGRQSIGMAPKTPFNSSANEGNMHCFT